MKKILFPKPKTTKKKTINIVLVGERPMSWNKYYSGMHWTKRAEETQRVHYLVLSQLKSVQLFTKPVNISIIGYFKGVPQDCDNICAKVYIDALKGKIIKDDSPDFVESVTTKSKKDKDYKLEINIQ